MSKQHEGTHEDFVPVGVHLVGSIPLPNPTDVFVKTSKALPGRLARIPDGEPAERHNFIGFQRNVFTAYPQVLRHYDASLTPIPGPIPSSSELESITAAITESGPLQTTYDTNAIASYKLFDSARSSGSIPPGTKFQVSIPTPVNVLNLIADGYQAALEPLYEAALMHDLKNIENTIPHSDLSIQWDVAGEFAMLEGAT